MARVKNDERKGILPVNKPEILAPAGGLVSVFAAMAAGADAVYIGGESFGARAFADNPSKEELLEAIDLVHLRGKRLYLTVNTLVKEQEYSSLYEFLAPFYAHGLDAAIVQDVGVVRFLSEEFPGLSLHASTQMTLTLGEEMSLLEGYPVTRLVPARELSLDEVTRVCSVSKKEVEVFVHGALCYCYSGQCLMSSLIGGRSGNRGRCAQPCRMEYKRESGEKGFFLSPKDQCGIPYLPELIETGAASFKIEGRMKKPEYTAVVTAAYRRLVDLYFSLSPEGYRRELERDPMLLSETMTELSEIYNRGGFSTGFWHMRNGEQLLSSERPGHYGVKVGRVNRDSRGEATILLERSIHPQDVLELRRGAAVGGQRTGRPEEHKNEQSGQKGYYEYTVKSKEEAGKQVTARLLPTVTAKKGDFVYRIRNNELLSKLQESYIDRKTFASATGHFVAAVGEPMTFTVGASCNMPLAPRPFGNENAEEVSVTVTGPVCERAGKLPATVEQVERQLRKTGNDLFSFGDHQIKVELVGEVFLPNGQLNELRRGALAALKEELVSRYRRELPRKFNACPRADDGMESPSSEESSSESYVDCLVSTLEQLSVVTEAPHLRRVYLEPFLKTEALRTTIDQLHERGKEVFLCLPRILRADHIERLKSFVSEMTGLADGFLVRNLGVLSVLLDRKEKRPSLVLDANVYAMSREAKLFYEELGIGANALTAPVELSAKELRMLDIHDMTLIAYGRLPLMVSAHCVRKNRVCCDKTNTETDELIDRVGKTLVVMRNCAECYNVILNPECLYLLSEKQELSKLKPYAIRLDFTVENASEVKNILRCQECGADAPARTGYTRGHFYRGVE